MESRGEDKRQSKQCVDKYVVGDEGSGVQIRMVGDLFFIRTGCVSTVGASCPILVGRWTP